MRMLDSFSDFQHFPAKVFTAYIAFARLVGAMGDMAGDSVAVGIKIGDFNALDLLSSVDVVPMAIKGDAVLGLGVTEPIGVLVEVSCLGGYGKVVAYAFHVCYIGKLYYPCIL